MGSLGRSVHIAFKSGAALFEGDGGSANPDCVATSCPSASCFPWEPAEAAFSARSGRPNSRGGGSTVKTDSPPLFCLPAATLGAFGGDFLPPVSLPVQRLLAL